MSQSVVGSHCKFGIWVICHVNVNRWGWVNENPHERGFGYIVLLLTNWCNHDKLLHHGILESVGGKLQSKMLLIKIRVVLKKGVFGAKIHALVLQTLNFMKRELHCCMVLMK